MDSRRILLVLCIAIGLNCAEAEAGQSGPSQLRIVLHNQADLPARQLEAVRGRVAGILRDAGVQVVWHQGPPSLQTHSSFVVNVLLRRQDPNWAPNRRPVMGMALASDQHRGSDDDLLPGDCGRRSQVHPLGDRSPRHRGHPRDWPPAPSTSAHAAEGIMRADWEGDDIRHAVNEPLQFTAVQAELVRLKLSGASEKPTL